MCGISLSREDFTKSVFALDPIAWKDVDSASSLFEEELEPEEEEELELEEEGELELEEEEELELEEEELELEKEEELELEEEEELELEEEFIMCVFGMTKLEHSSNNKSDKPLQILSKSCSSLLRSLSIFTSIFASLKRNGFVALIFSILSLGNCICFGALEKKCWMTIIIICHTKEKASYWKKIEIIIITITN